MINEIAKTESFEERMYQKIRADIGTLMTDEELKKLVETAVERTFFKETSIKSKDYPYKDVTIPPVINRLAKELLADRIDKILNEWLDRHAAEVRSIFQETLQDGFIAALQRIIDSRMNPAMMALSSALEDVIGKNNLKRY